MAFASVVLLLPAVECVADELVLARSRTPLALPFYVADAEGYFGAEGVKIRQVDCLTGRQCLKRLLDGEAQAATVAEAPIVFTSFTRADFVIVATFVTSTNDSKLVARKGAGINTPKDLAGKRVGTMIGTSAHYLLDSSLLFYGADPATVKIVALQPEMVVSAIEKGDVDAVALFEPFAFDAAKAFGPDRVVVGGTRLFTESFNLVVARQLTGTRDADLIKMLRAIERAERFIHEEPRKAQAILRERLKLNQDFIDWVWRDFNYALSLDQSLVTTLESVARWAVREGHVRGKKPADYLDYVYPAPLAKVLPGAVTVVK